MPLWAGFIAAPIAAGLFSFLVGLPALRLSGEYLAIATYAAAEVLRAVFTNEDWLTNGVVGFNNLRQPFRGAFASGDVYQYFFMALSLAVLFILFLILSRLHWGPFGRALRAIRENEQVALSVGKNVTKLRIKAFVLGGAVSGFAAALYVSFATLIVPTMFVSEVTWTVWIALVIGGTGNYVGALVGTAVLVTAQELTRFFQASADLASVLAASRLIAMGLILIVIIRFRPRGILPERHYVDTEAVPVAESTAQAVSPKRVVE
jgi:branched-chain amino acid transport system permease protein